MEPYWRADAAGDVSTPVLKPRLPGLSEIEPYLRRIDVNRWYSNSGPLVREFEARLAAQAGAEPTSVTTVANATLGLVLGLQTLALPAGSLCMVPAWTFAATAHAIRLAELVPWIVDVDEKSWALEASTAEGLLSNAPASVSAVMPVAPFGRPMNLANWERFRDKTGVAVLIDAAAAFDTIIASSVPAVVSLHATKVIGIGEGGYVVSNDSRFIEDIQKRANFGFWGSREASVPGLNGKISEYAAAIGLAALASWPSVRHDFMRVAVGYRRGFAGRNDVVIQDGLGEAWIASTISVVAATAGAEAVSSALTGAAIGSRRWYGGGLHRHAAFSSLPRTEVENTERLVEGVLGLPCWPDLPDDAIARICDIVSQASL